MVPTTKMFSRYGKIANNFFALVNCSFCNQVRYSSSKTMSQSDSQWEHEKTRMLQLPLEERRQNYSCKDFLKLDQIYPWRNYAVKNKGLQAKKHTTDDLSELKTITLNSDLNKELTTRVSIFKGDITKLEVDAIVNAANSLLKAGGGVDGAIHRAAGSLLQKECNTLGGCKTGEAKITGGYSLPAKYVIATVGPQDGNPKKLEECYKNALSFYKSHKIKSIAFPCISTGIYGFPNRLAAHIALRTARKFLEEHDSMERIIFCTFMPIDVDIYETLMQMYFPLHEWNYEDGPSVTE